MRGGGVALPIQGAGPGRFNGGKSTVQIAWGTCYPEEGPESAGGRPQSKLRGSCLARLPFPIVGRPTRPVQSRPAGEIARPGPPVGGGAGAAARGGPLFPPSAPPYTWYVP